MKNLILYFLSNVLIISSICAQTTVVLTADYDAPIGYHDNYNDANTNYGTGTQNAAFVLPGNNGGLNVNRALLHFDLSNIPAGAIILSAKLNLYALGPVGSLSGHTGTNNSAVLQRVIQPWADNTVTWNNQPNTTTQNAVLLPSSTHALQDYLNIDVALLVEDMISTNNYGFLLKLINEVQTNALVFASLNCGDTTNFPKIEITYLVNCLNLSSNDAPIGYHDNFNDANTNYGGGPQNAAYVIPGNQGGLNVNRSLMFFDLTGIPNGAEVTSAKLSLFAYGILGPIQGHTGPNNSAVLQRVLQPWAENTVTWNNQPTASTLNEVILPASTTFNQDYIDIDVTLLVQDMLLTNNYGFKMKLVDETLSKALLFCSEDHPNSQKRPTMEVCFKMVTAIEQTNLTQNGFEIFPNPASGYTTVTCRQLLHSANALVEIFSINGQLLERISFNNPEIIIDTRALREGLYLIKLTTGKQSKIKKLVVIK